MMWSSIIKMRLFLGVVLVVLTANKIEADPKECLYFVSPDDINYLHGEINANSANSLSDGIPNHQLHHVFFESLSEIFKQICETVVIAHFVISPIHPESLAVCFDHILEEMDDIYEGHQNLENMKANMATLRDQLNEYANEVTPLKFELFLNGTTFTEWIHLHANDFQNLKSDKKLVKYLKEIKQLIEAIQIAIKRHQRKIDDRQLDRLNGIISTSIEKYDEDAENLADLSNSLLEISKAVVGVMNTGDVWKNFKKNVENIIHDMNELKLLLEKQWKGLEYIFRNQKLPQEMPTVNFAVKNQARESSA